MRLVRFTNKIQHVVFAAMLASFFLAATGVVDAAPVDNSQITYDTTGARLDAHDGMIQVDPHNPGHYYLFGTSYACGFMLNSKPASPYCGVRIYTSTDLQTWTPVGAYNGKYAFDYTTSYMQGQCNSAAFGCFRPKVLARPDGTWVMWLNAGRNTHGYLVFTAPSVTGPYTLTATPPTLGIVPACSSAGLCYGDEDVYQSNASSTAVAYIAYTVIGINNTHQIAMQKLDSTWTTGSGAAKLIPAPVSPALVEAPSIFARGSTWYVGYSQPACPYCNTAADGYAMASSPLGNYTTHAVFNTFSCSGQFDDVNVLNGVYVWQTDRWAQLSGGGPDPNQTNANNYLAPLTFNSDGTIPHQNCIPTWTFKP